jgi:hypothetical protein
MDNPVLALLADKVTNILPQTLVRDLILVVAHRLNKKPFAIGKMQRQGIEKACKNRVTSIPVARDSGNVELDLTGLNWHSVSHVSPPA